MPVAITRGRPSDTHQAERTSGPSHRSELCPAEEVWQAALSANHLFHVLTSEGELVAVNPHQIVYIEAEDQARPA
jgi:hypothetical protein